MGRLRGAQCEGAARGAQGEPSAVAAQGWVGSSLQLPGRARARRALSALRLPEPCLVRADARGWGAASRGVAQALAAQALPVVDLLPTPVLLPGVHVHLVPLLSPPCCRWRVGCEEARLRHVYLSCP